MAIKLNWTDTNSIEDGHRIYRSSSPMDPEALPAPLAEVGPGVTEYVDETALPNTTYYYRVAAFLAGLQQVGAEIQVTNGNAPGRAKLMLSVDELEVGLNNNLLLSGDAQSGTDLLEL